MKTEYSLEDCERDEKILQMLQEIYEPMSRSIGELYDLIVETESRIEAYYERERARDE